MKFWNIYLFSKLPMWKYFLEIIRKMSQRIKYTSQVISKYLLIQIIM